jgi:ferrous iron transport protein B
METCVNRPQVPECSREDASGSRMKKMVILGNPNVGKSLLFNHLTGRYVTVANYPGTTVEVARGKVRIDDFKFEVLDTPGMYSLMSITEEEKVARNILFSEDLFLVIHVIDAKNLEHMLPLTLQLIEASFPVLLVLNMMDEARSCGIEISARVLSAELGIPVVETVLTTGEGLNELDRAILKAACVPLKGKPEVQEETEADSEFKISQALEMAIQLKRKAAQISEQVFRVKKWGAEGRGHQTSFSEFLGRLTIHPVTGFPILLLILYFGVYQFVGVFGAGVVVNFLEQSVFEERLNPVMIHFVNRVIPWPIFASLFVGEYGILTQGLRYAIALILPIISFYFAVFAIIEDTGYLPRLAMLMDRTLKKIGLSGRAVIPLVLGLGCDTMATVVTRTLPTAKERLITTLLLSLAIPCSAQLGVILAILGPHPRLFFLWLSVITSVFLVAGFFASRILPGRKASFYMELPPLRLPKISHVLTKTYVRVEWYFKEVLPLFILASALIWLGQLSGFFALLNQLLAVPVRMAGLPIETAPVFLMGFFRRDYGAAGLYDLVRNVALNETQILVACVALTLFLPCIAQFLINMKERGFKTGLGISLFVLSVSFAVAVVLNAVLSFWKGIA